MKYRPFGTLDWQGSVLGFGTARLPSVEGDPKTIDEPASIALLRHAIDHGVNYIDTGYDYWGGQAEPVIGQALQDGYREKVRVATKLPCWMVKTLDDCDRFLDEQLERLQTDQIDVYLFHRLNTLEGTWPGMRDLGAIEWAEGAIACVACECEPKCSQHIAISEWMPQVHAVLGEGADCPG